MLPQERFMYRG